MGICITGISALEAYRASGRLAPDLLSRPRTSKLDGCGTLPTKMLEDEMLALGVRGRPYHLLSDSPNAMHSRQDICRHICSVDLPRRALICAKRDVLIASPELAFVHLATSPDYDEIDLALIGYELCGTYRLDPEETWWSGLLDGGDSLASTASLARMIEQLRGQRGVGKAARALKLVSDGSNSPMETVLAALLCFPRSAGGLGFGPFAMNRKISTPVGDKWVDILLLNHKVGLEYKGREAHSIERVSRDDRRQNKLVGSGVAILNVWYEDIANPHLFGQLIRDIENATGTRLRIRLKGFAQRQELLRLRLMPAAQKYGSFVF